jgi:hypothetical protein
MTRRWNIFTISALAFCAAANSAGADDKTVLPPERKEFHMSGEYPFIFRSENYLKVQVPVPMRYGEPAIDTCNRNAPPLPASAKGTPPAKAKPTPEGSGTSTTPAPLPSSAPQGQSQASSAASSTVQVVTSNAAYPVPDNGPEQPHKGDADFTKAPDEVVGYFRNQYTFVPDSHRFFDPIFDPAVPQSAQAGPKSSATYTVSP